MKHRIDICLDCDKRRDGLPYEDSTGRNKRDAYCELKQDEFFSLYGYEIKNYPSPWMVVAKLDYKTKQWTWNKEFNVPEECPFKLEHTLL